jgi:hypothetical protein
VRICKDSAPTPTRASSGRELWSGERRDYDEGVVIMMLDPEEHEFCLVQYYD